jgi:hypothetical protein
MQLLVQANQVLYYGKIKDLLSILAGYPPETTLKDYINQRLN